MVWCWCVAVLFDPPQIDNDAGLARGRATAPYLIACFNGPLKRIPGWKCHQSKSSWLQMCRPCQSGRIKAALQKRRCRQTAVERKNRYPRCYTLYSPQRCRLPWRIDYSSGESDDLSRSHRTTPGGTLPGTGCAVTNGPTTDDERGVVGSPQLGAAGAVHFPISSCRSPPASGIYLAYSVPVFRPISGCRTLVWHAKNTCAICN